VARPSRATRATDRLLASARPYGGLAGARLIIFHGEVSEDSDGPVEICVPIEPVRPLPDTVAVRTELEHREAYVPIPPAQFAVPQILSTYDAIVAWAAENDVTIVGSLARSTEKTSTWKRRDVTTSSATWPSRSDIWRAEITDSPAQSVRRSRWPGSPGVSVCEVPEHGFIPRAITSGSRWSGTTRETKSSVARGLRGRVKLVLPDRLNSAPSGRSLARVVVAVDNLSGSEGSTGSCGR